jgi:hypothetical protein
MKSSTARLVVPFAFIALTVLAVQLFFLDAKFPLYRPTRWHPYATWLRNVGNVRIGAVRGHHGAELVRIPPGQPFTNEFPDDATGALRRTMLRDLSMTPVKAAGEYTMYLAIFFGGLYLLPRFLARRFGSSRLRWCFALGVSFFAAALLAQIPLLFHYDTSIFTTWYGPGPYAYSTGHLWITHSAGYSVSYRPFLEHLMLPPLELLAAHDLLPDGEGLWSWIVLTAEISGLYGIVGALLGLIADVVNRRWVRARHLLSPLAEVTQ